MMTSVPGFQNSQTFLWLLNDFANKFHDFPMLFLGVISHKASFHEAFEKRMLTEKKMQCFGWKKNMKVPRHLVTDFPMTFQS